MNQPWLITSDWPLRAFDSNAAKNSPLRVAPLRAVAHKPAFMLDEESIQQSLYWHERRSALVLDQDHQEFRRLGIACVPVNDMNIVGAFIEGLSWCQCYLLSTLQLHHNGALQHVNKGMCIVSVDRARPAGRMLDRDHQSFPAGTLRQIFRHERCDLGLLSHRRTGHEAQQNQCNEFDRHSRLFRSSPGTSSCQRISPGRTSDAGSGCCL